MNPSPLYVEPRAPFSSSSLPSPGRCQSITSFRPGSTQHGCVRVLAQDHGRSWSPPTDLTDSVIASADKDWATFAVGPGHAGEQSDGAWWCQPMLTAATAA